jgi:hypothetical protein
MLKGNKEPGSIGRTRLDRYFLSQGKESTLSGGGKEAFVVGELNATY